MTRKHGLLGIILRYEWLVLLAATPLLVFPNALRSLALIVLPVLWIIRKIKTGRFFDRTPLDWPLAFLMLMVLISLYATYDIAVSLKKINGMVLGLAIYYAVIQHCADRQSLNTGIAVFILTGMGIASFALIGTNWNPKFAFLTPFLEALPPRITGLPGAEMGFHPNEVAGSLLWVLPLAWTLVVLALTQAPVIQRKLGRGWAAAALVLITLLAGAMTFVFILTQSRGGYLAFVFVVPFVLLTYMQGRARRILLIGLVFLIGFSGLGFAYVGADQVLDPMKAWFQDDNPAASLSNLSGRLELWSRAIYGIQDFAFTGMGMNTFREVVHILYPLFHIGPDMDIGHAHNEFLQAALDLGIPGLIAFLSVNLGAFWMLVQTWKRRGRLPFPESLSRALILGLGGGLAAHMIYGLLDTVALGAKPGIIWWMLLGLIASLYRGPSLRKQVANRD